MPNWGGILATAMGGAGEGGFEAYGEDIKKRRDEAIETRKREASDLRKYNLARIKQTWAQKNIKLEDQLTTKRTESEQKFEAGELEKGRKSREKIAGIRAGSKKETASDKKYTESQALKKVYMDLGSKGIPVQETESGMVVAQIPTDEKGKPLDMGVLQAIDQAGLQFKTGQPRKSENNWFSPDEWVTEVYIGGMKPGDSGLLSGGGTAGTEGGIPNPNVGNVSIDDLFNAADKRLKKTGTDKTPDESEGQVKKSGILTQEEPGKSKTEKEIPYHTSMTEPPSKEQEETAKEELNNLARKLGVAPENWKALAEQAKSVGGWAWDAYQKWWTQLLQGQKEAKKSLPAYK